MSILDSLFNGISAEDVAAQQRIDDLDREATFNRYVSEELQRIISRLEVIERRLKGETTQ